MGRHDHDDLLLAAFLAGDLNPALARRWDEHLLDCERCWRAVRQDRAGRQAAQVMRQPVPPGLADCLAFAVEVAAVAGAGAQRRPGEGVRSRRPGRHARLRWRLAATGVIVSAMAAVLTMLLLPVGRQVGGVPAAVAAVARYARDIPPPAVGQRPSSGWHAAPVEVGRPVLVTAGGQRIVLRTWRVGGAEAAVAASARPFPMPAYAKGVSGRGMAWSARLGRLRLYCLNGQPSELVAAPVPMAELAALAARLTMAGGG
jgi:hypothetical protein